MLKDIRIFVASSKELLPERNALSYFVLAQDGVCDEQNFASDRYGVRK